MRASGKWFSIKALVLILRHRNTAIFLDLPKRIVPGLRDAIEVLSEVSEISMTFFETVDVVRHPLVQKVVAAYEKYEGK